MTRDDRVDATAGASFANDHRRPDPNHDRQARNVIIAAERLGFQREPELPFRWYDHDLHDDAEYAVRHLRERDPDALREALAAEDEPIPADRAAYRIVETGGFSLADAYVVIPAAAKLGFKAPPGLMGDSLGTFDDARVCGAFLWEHHPSRLDELFGECARLAPLPVGAECPWRRRWWQQHRGA